MKKGSKMSEESREKMRLAIAKRKELGIKRVTKKVDCKCHNCGEIFKRIPSRGYRKYCSEKCMYEHRAVKGTWNKGTKGEMPTPWNKGLRKKDSDKIKGGVRMGVTPWNKGLKMEESVKKKLSENKKGQRVSVSTEFKKGFIPWNYGKECLYLKGSKNARWKGGISSQRKVERNMIQYYSWRRIIFYRDNYTCQMCSKKGGDIHAHHIKKFSERHDLRFDIYNGITLCKKCHEWTHYKEHLFEEQFTNMVKKQLAA